MQLDIFTTDIEPPTTKKNSVANKLDVSDKQFHNWYRFVLSFPPHLVRNYLYHFNLKPGNIILDPFCGTGTTIVEAKLHSISGIGIEANPIAHFASSVKVNWDIDPNELLKHATLIASQANEAIISYKRPTYRNLCDETISLLLKDSISPLPLHKTLILLEYIKRNEGLNFYLYEMLALAKSLVFSISNLHFGPEVGVSKNKKIDAPVIENWLTEVKYMVIDLHNYKPSTTTSIIHYADSRNLTSLLQPNSIDAVFTSPPYPNEKDYTRTTRLESVILGFIRNKKDLRTIKHKLLCSNTRNVYKGEHDDIWIANYPKIQALADEIENRRILLGKTSGFEKLYSKVTKLYFGGVARHLSELRPFLKPGAYLGYVVGDQASYFQIMIHTGQLLADIAQSLGYQVENIELFRTRLSTVTQKQMREEVVVLRWLGNS